MKLEHVRLAAALATVAHARGHTAWNQIARDVRIRAGLLILFAQGDHDVSAKDGARIRAYLHLKHADVMHALGDAAPPADDPDMHEIARDLMRDMPASITIHESELSKPSQTYTCAECGGTFAKVRDDGEAMAEATAAHPDVKPENMAVVCDDCYRKMGSPNERRADDCPDTCICSCDGVGPCPGGPLSEDERLLLCVSCRSRQTHTIADGVDVPITRGPIALSDEPCAMCGLRPSDSVPPSQARCGHCLRGN